ncbi:calcium-dependent secretion activator 2-like isoform X2 [Dysidea avara]|uniref:calcium-dependent secretion activator 2-like isoform X2 n=1 Tax=Dysidea avara TaxID=196820 RepID=UPI0033260A0D
MIANDEAEDSSCSSTENIPVIWPKPLHDNSTEARSNDETSLVQSSDKYFHQVTVSSEYSSDPSCAHQVQNEREDGNRFRLYLLLLRCIAYPFNPYSQPTTTVFPMRLTKSSYRAICDKIAVALTDPTTEAEFCSCLKWYYKVVLNRNDVIIRATNGEFSLRELRHIFKIHAHRHLCKAGKDSIEESLHSCLSHFDELLDIDSREWFSSRRASTLPRVGLIKNPANNPIMNTDSFYRMFQEILKISPIDHHAIVTEYQINNREEQESVLKQELKARIEKASKPDGFSYIGIFSAERREQICSELVAHIRKLLKKVELPHSPSYPTSHYYSKRKRRSKLRTILSVDVSSESGEDTIPKNNICMKFQLKVTVHEAIDIVGVSEGQSLYCEFQLIGNSHQPLVTDGVTPDDGCARFDTEGSFETSSPVPGLKLQLKVVSKGIFKNDKILGKVVINPCPSAYSFTEMIDMASPDQKQGPRLRITINMKMPPHMKRCGFLYAQGCLVFQEWKKRFFALVYFQKYLLCSYAINGTSPRKVLALDGYTVDYLENTSTAGRNSGQVEFVIFKEPCRIQFGVRDSNERQGWLQWLTRATAQSYKPCPPDSTTSSEGTSLLMLDQLRQFSSTSISDTVHQELLNKLYHMMLNYRMKETVFSRGLFSPDQNYVLEEYCQRYGIRSIFLHLVTLSESVAREWAGHSCDPVMMLSSFTFCKMAINGKVQDHLVVVTTQDSEMFLELCKEIDELLKHKIENFRSCFPFACPKSDLEVSLKLFCAVSKVLLTEGEELSTELRDHNINEMVESLLKKAALCSYKALLNLLSADERTRLLTIPQLIGLTELSVEYMCELHDFFLSDLSQFPMALKIHVDSFWSMLEVDITTTLKQLLLSDLASGEILRVFYKLNHYCITQNLTDGFHFHEKLQQLFLPVVIQYLGVLDSAISRDLQALFLQEKWLQECPCVATIAACLEALHSIQQMIQELQWPDEDINCHLQQRCYAISAEQLRYCTNMTLVHLRSVISEVPQTYDMKLPQQAFSMLCSLCHLQQQAMKLLKPTRREMANYHGDIASFILDACHTAATQISEKASQPLKLLLQQLSQWDTTSGLSKLKKIFYLSSVPVEDYVQCMSTMLEDVVQYCYMSEAQQILLKKWFGLQCASVQLWLKQRPDFSLCPDQYQTISIIMKSAAGYWDGRGAIR